jgi:hypothetical protein
MSKQHRLAQWAIRRFLVKRIKAFFGGLLTPTTSEFWLGWGSLLAKLACTFPAACTIIEAVAKAMGFPSGDVLIGTILAYVLARMTSKAAKATT